MYKYHDLETHAKCQEKIVNLHLDEDEEPEIGHGQNIDQESLSNDLCSFCHITKDKYCNDKANN